MSTATKLSYLNETKSQLKDMINYGLDDNNKITSSTTFRNYVSSIFNAFLEALRTPDTLFTNLPKKSGTGAVISLNDTANAPMRIELGASELTQDATPTPSSPQDIHTISGSNKVVVCGKNLFDKNNTTILNAYVSNSGQWLSSNAGEKSFIMKVQPNTTYTLTKLSGVRTRVAENSTSDFTFNSTYTLLLNKSSSNTGGTFTTGVNGNYIAVFFLNNNSETYTAQQMIDSLQIEVGSSSSTYEPYVSQEADIDLDTIEYCKIGNYEDKFIRTSGKNLGNPIFESHLYMSGSGSNRVVAQNTNSLQGQVIKVKPSTSYTIKGTFTDFGDGVLRIGEFANEPQLNDHDLAYHYGASDIVFTTTSTTNYLLLFDTRTRNVVVNDLFVCETQYANEFEPYGNGTWYIKKNIGKIVLDGTENGWNMSRGTGRYSFWIFNTNIPNALNTYYYKYCDNFKYYYEPFSTASIPSLCENTMVPSAYTMFVFNTDGSQGTTVADWKTWLSNNNTIVYYVLSTPTYTQITGTLANQLENVYQKLLSYTGTTNISQVNNDLAFNLSVQAIEKL